MRRRSFFARPFRLESPSPECLMVPAAVNLDRRMHDAEFGWDTRPVVGRRFRIITDDGEVRRVDAGPDAPAVEVRDAVA